MINKKLVTKLAFVLMVAVTFFAACTSAPKSKKTDMKDDMQMKSEMKDDMNMKDKDMKDKDMKSDSNMKDDMNSDMMKDGKKK